jgi:hypothetical protein
MKFALALKKLVLWWQFFSSLSKPKDKEADQNSLNHLDSEMNTM